MRNGVMFLITIAGKEEEGAYSVHDEMVKKHYICLKKRMMLKDLLVFLEADDYPKMDVVEVDDEVAINTCNVYNYRYVIITVRMTLYSPQR